MKTFKVACRATFDVEIEATSRAHAEKLIRARFHHTRPFDELEGTALPKGGRIMGVKTETYEASES